MKKWMSLLLALLLLVPMTAAAEEEWMELSNNGQVLTVRLPAEAASDSGWRYEISDEQMLEMLTMETVDGLWVASFASITGPAGDVTLRLICDGENVLYKQMRDVAISVAEDHVLTLQNWNVLPAEELWYSLFDPAVLSVKLPVKDGYEWTCAVSDEALLETLSEQTTYNGPIALIKGLDSTFCASFRGLQPGEAELVLECVAPEGSPVERRVIVLEVGEDLQLHLRAIEWYSDEDGFMMLQQVESFPEAIEQWYDLTDPTRMIVSLPVADANANAWTVEISDPDVLEMAESEMLAYKTAGAFVATFRGLQPGSVQVKFVNTAAQADDMTVERILQLRVTEELHIEIAEMLNTK